MGHSSVPVGFFSEKSTPYSFLQNARPPGSLRSPSELRAETFFQKVPVFRMAYSAPTAHCAVSSETLMLQPLRGLRTPHRPPVSLCFSPKRTTFRFASLTLRLRAETFFQKVPVFRMAYSAPTAHCAVSSETLMLQPLRGLRTPHRSPVSSPLAAAAALWLPCVRGAARRRAGLRGYLRVRGKGKGPAVPFPSLRTESAFQAAPVFRSAYSASRNARPPAASRPPSEHTVLFLPKRSCFRFASLTPRTAHRPIVSLCFSPKRTTFRFASLTLRTPHRPPVSSPLAAAAD